MYALLVTLLLGGPVEVHGIKSQGSEQPRGVHCEQRLAPVVLVADGNSEWSGQAASRIVDELKLELGVCLRLEVARFDAAPVLQHRFAVKGVNRDVIVVKPRIPMREVMEAGFNWLIDTPGPHTMIVIAHEQFYPTTVSQGRLLELARCTRTIVHTIHLASTSTRSGVFRRLGRSLRNEAVWTSEVLGMGEGGYSARDTARLLKVIADGTGGKACVANGERAAIDCARSVAADIAGPHARATSSAPAE